MLERQRRFLKEKWSEPKIGLLAVALLGILLISCSEQTTASYDTVNPLCSTPIESPLIFVAQPLSPEDEESLYPIGSCHQDESIEGEEIIWKRTQAGWVGPWDSLQECQQTPINTGLPCPPDQTNVCFENDPKDPEKSHPEAVADWYSCQTGFLYGPFTTEETCTQFDVTIIPQATPFPDVTGFLDIRGRNYISQPPPWLAMLISTYFPQSQGEWTNEWTNATRIAFAESSYRQYVVSTTGDVGVYQVNLKWQRKNLELLGLTINDMKNPVLNVCFAAWLLDQHDGYWDPTWHTAAALGIK